MAEPGNTSINWEAFYGNFRKPGYIPGFEILEKLGAGVFGLVYKARKESIGKLYAIKFLKVDDESVREAVVRELDTVRYFAQVDHPNLVAIEDKGEVDGIPYIVMAYAGDSSLRRLLDTEQIDREQALSIFVQIARGLQALHERSLVHFDLKPA
ncbi:MAG: protein kinase domain-containing protein, partial [Planctomycetota bacterium]